MAGNEPDIFSNVLAEDAYGPIYSAQYGDAVRSARANELGHRLGIPADIVEADMPNMLARDRLDRALDQSRMNAAYAQMMANKRLAAAGIDDQHLPRVAQAVDDHMRVVDFAALRKQYGWLGGSVAGISGGATVLAWRALAGIGDIASGITGSIHAGTTLLDRHFPGALDIMSGGPGLRELGDWHSSIAAGVSKIRFTTSSRTFNDVSSGVESAPTIATGVFGPEVPATLFAAEGFSDAYDEGVKSGLSPERSATYGAGDAAIAAATSFLPEKYLGGVFAGKGGIGKTVLSALGLNAAGTALTDLNRWLFIEQPKGASFDQFLSSLPDEERSSLVSTLVGFGLTMGAGRLASRVADRAADKDSAEHLDGVMEAAAQSSTRTANPSDFEAALNQLVGDSNASDIYVPAEKVLGLFQREEGGPQRNIRSDPFWSQYAGQVEEAATLGGDVVIPLSSAATHLAGSPDWQALREFVRTRPGGASMAEIKASQSPEELEALAREVAQKLDEAVPHLKAEGLTREFADRLGYKGEQADAISRLLGSGLARAYALEKARGGKASLDEFAQWWVPEAEKTTQAAYDKERLGKPGKAQELGDTQRRGNISIARDEKGVMTNAVIRSFEASDFSTAIHESGHFFLEDLKRRAVGEGASDQEKADWESVKQWMTENGHGLEDDAVPEAAHEMFARGFERYIYEGKTPSRGLKSVFARMRDFMVSLYRSIRSFNSPITPEIRKVMDRLLASDEEIAAREQELLLGEKALAGLMSEEEQARYLQLGNEAREEARDKLHDRVLSTLRAERTRSVARRKAEIREGVTDETDRQPVFRALRLLRSGIPNEEGETARATLPRQWLTDNYGEEIVDQLPKGVPPIVDDTHAVDPESLAEMAGFDSADQMVRKLIAHEEERKALKANGDNRSPRRAAIEGLTEERLRNEMGDPFANLEEEADAALANDRQADKLSLELRALSRKTGKAPVPWKLAKDWARAHVRSATSKDAISGAAMQSYSKASAKAAQNVEEALVKGDYEAAFRAKQQQVLNLALMSEAKAAKDEVLSAAKGLRRIAKAENIPSVDQDYLDQAHRLLENVDLKQRPAVAVDKRMAFEAWHAKQVEMEIEPVVPPEYQSLLGQTHWTRLPINDLLDLDKAVKQIVKLGRLKQELRDRSKARDYNEGVGEMQDIAGRVPPRKPRGKSTDPRRSWLGRASSKIRSIDAAMVKAERAFIWMDHWTENGPWQRLLYRPFAEAQGAESDLNRQYAETLNPLIKSLPKETVRSWMRWVDTPELVIRNPNHSRTGDAWHGTKDQVVLMALNWGNLGNRQRLLDGFGFHDSDMAAVFDRVMKKEDWDFVQGVWNSLEVLRPHIAQLERDVNGVEPEWVDPAEVPTRHGTYKGGYFPIVYDPMETTAAAQAIEDKLAPSGGWWSISTRASATKERAEQVKGRPILLSMDVITRHVGEVVHDITHRQAVSQARKLLGDQRVTNLINSRLGPEYLKSIRGWLEGIARPNSAYSRENPALVSIARYLNKSITTTGLGFRLSTSLVQSLGIPFSAKDVGANSIRKGLAIVTAHPVRAYNEMLEKSPEMRARSDALDDSIMDLANEHADGKLKTIGKRGIAKYAFQGIAWMDVVSRTTVWTSAYNKALVDGMEENDAIYYADRIVRESHGIGFQKDRSAIQRAHPFARAWYQFFSYMNALYNAQRDTARRVVHAETASDYAEAARRSWWVFVVPALLHSLILGNGPDDKDGKGATAEDWAKYLGKEVLLGNLGSIPIIGEIGKAFGEGYDYRGVSWLDIVAQSAQGAKSLYRWEQGKSELKGSGIQSALTAVGMLTAKPLGQPAATLGGVYDYETGHADPQTAGDWYNLLTRGHIPNKPTTAERLAGHN